MANFFTPNSPGNTFLDWNYVTYFGDGIPLLFWIFAYPYNGCPYANEYRWLIGNEANGKTTRFSNEKNLNGAANSFIQFPTNTAYTSNVLFNLTRNSRVIGPYNNYHAAIVIDSPWARSCDSREMAPESEKNENYAVGLSLDMGLRIAKSFPNWSQWWNNICTNCGCDATESLSLLPEYLKDALMQARGLGQGDLGGIRNLDILMFAPDRAVLYLPGEEQAGLLLPEIGMAETKIIATQCEVDAYSWQVNPFGKAFIGASIAIYRDYSEVNNAVIKNLIIDVPWSGVLTGVTTYKSNQILPFPQCTLSCPNHIYFNTFGKFSTCNYNPADPYNESSLYIDRFSWQPSYPAPFTFPRIGCQGNSMGSDPCIGTTTSFFVNGVWSLSSAGGLKITAGDGFIQNNCTYPSYNIGSPNSPVYYNPTYSDFFSRPPIFGQSPAIIDIVGPWKMEYSFFASRAYAAGGGCESAAFQPWDV